MTTAARVRALAFVAEDGGRGDLCVDRSGPGEQVVADHAPTREELLRGRAQ